MTDQPDGFMSDIMLDLYMLYSNVYVLDAFDSAGTPIMNGDSTSVCERINFLMENSEINNYYNAITDSTVYYVKHID